MNELDGIPLILDNCSIDDSNPYSIPGLLEASHRVRNADTSRSLCCELRILHGEALEDEMQ